MNCESGCVWSGAGSGARWELSVLAPLARGYYRQRRIQGTMCKVTFIMKTKGTSQGEIHSASYLGCRWSMLHGLHVNFGLVVSQAYRWGHRQETEKQECGQKEDDVQQCVFKSFV